jgi:hypothetical protein
MKFRSAGETDMAGDTAPRINVTRKKTKRMTSLLTINNLSRCQCRDFVSEFECIVFIQKVISTPVFIAW